MYKINITYILKLFLLFFIMIFIMNIIFISSIIRAIESQQELIEKQQTKIEYIENIINDLNQF